MRRRISKPNPESGNDKNVKVWILVSGGYGFQKERPGYAPGWGHPDDATAMTYAEAEKARDEQIKYFRRFPDIVRKKKK